MAGKHIPILGVVRLASSLPSNGALALQTNQYSYANDQAPDDCKCIFLHCDSGGAGRSSYKMSTTPNCFDRKVIYFSYCTNTSIVQVYHSMHSRALSNSVTTHQSSAFNIIDVENHPTGDLKGVDRRPNAREGQENPMLGFRSRVGGGRWEMGDGRRRCGGRGTLGTAAGTRIRANPPRNDQDRICCVAPAHPFTCPSVHLDARTLEWLDIRSRPSPNSLLPLIIFSSNLDNTIAQPETGAFTQGQSAAYAPSALTRSPSKIYPAALIPSVFSG